MGMVSVQPSEVLLEGVRLLEPVLAPHGVRFEFRGTGRGSGGDFAWGEFARGDRRLELHFMYSLGLVTYHVGEFQIAPEPYLRALGVPRGANRYPGFSDEPLDGFRGLAHDVGRFGGEFLSGDAAVLCRAARAEMARLAAEQQRYCQRSFAGSGRRHRPHTRPPESARILLRAALLPV
jgi:hypothetical protein